MASLRNFSLGSSWRHETGRKRSKQYAVVKERSGASLAAPANGIREASIEAGESIHRASCWNVCRATLHPDVSVAWVQRESGWRIAVGRLFAAWTGKVRCVTVGGAEGPPPAN